MSGHAKGRVWSPAPAVLSCAGKRANYSAAGENLQVARGLPFQRLTLATTHAPEGCIPAVIRHDGRLVLHHCLLGVALALPSWGRA
jgi:hypothetical protein